MGRCTTRRVFTAAHAPGLLDHVLRPGRRNSHPPRETWITWRMQMKRCARGWTLPSKGRKCRGRGWKSDRVRKRSKGECLVHVARREFFLYGTATQVRRKRCCGCLGRRNLLQRHVTSLLGGRVRRREKKRNVAYTEILLHCFLCAHSATRDSVFQVRSFAHSSFGLKNLRWM